MNLPTYPQASAGQNLAGFTNEVVAAGSGRSQFSLLTLNEPAVARL